MRTRATLPLPAAMALGLILGLAPGLAPGPAAAQMLEADLSKYRVAITTGFTGSQVLLFGAIDSEGDIIVVVRGPASRAVVRRKSRLAGIWVNRDEIVFTGVPAFYAVASSAPLDTLVKRSVAARQQIGAENLRLTAESPATALEATVYREALLRNQARIGLYRETPGVVTFLPSRRLFKTVIEFPANVPTGEYSVQVFLVRDGYVVSAQTTPLKIRKAGLEAEIFDFAHRQKVWYGLIAIALALVAGWGAGQIFRRA